MRSTMKELKLKPEDIIECFIKSIFYIGKGTNTRPNDHLKEALTNKKSQKIERINQILKTKKPNSEVNFGIVIIQICHNSTNKQSLMREAAMIKAIGLDNLTNVKDEKFKAENWNEEV
jgi:hypothetical protein